MQFGHALGQILRRIILSNPAFWTVRLMKVDISDGFYQIDVNVDDVPKLGVAFPTEDDEEPLDAFLLDLSVGTDKPKQDCGIIPWFLALATLGVATRRS